MKKKKDTITTKDLDRRFDEGEDISKYLDWSKATRPGLKQRRMNMDLPVWMISSQNRLTKHQAQT